MTIDSTELDALAENRLRTWRIAPVWATVAVLAAVAATAASLAVPGLVGHCVAALAYGQSTSEPIAVLALVLGVAAMANVATTFCTGAFTAAVTARLRADLIRSIMFAAPRPVGHFPDSGTDGTSDLVTRLLVDARQPASALPIATSLLLSLVSLVTGLVMLALIDWWLLVGLMGGLLLLTVLLRRFVADTTPLVGRYREAQAQVGERLLDAQRGAVSIRAYGTWRRELDRVVAPLHSVHDAGDALWAAQRHFAWRTAIFVPAMQLVTVAIGGVSLSAGRIGVGQFTAAFGYCILVLGALDGIESVAGLNVVKAGSRRVAALLHRAPPPNEGWPGVSKPLDVVLDEVTVLGDGATPILDRVNAAVPAGGFVAITGPSGSGRSTLAGVIAGTITPDSGRVLVGGVPLTDWHPDARAALITLASSRPPLLGDTVGGLIGLGLGPVPEHTLHRAARHAHIADVVDALPSGLHTRLDTLELSGGELQRLGIAQAIARDSRVIVLDDATTSLDAATEREVVSALLAARTDRTCILVTDRPAVVRRADVVISLDRARLVAPARAEARG